MGILKAKNSKTILRIEFYGIVLMSSWRNLIKISEELHSDSKISLKIEFNESEDFACWHFERVKKELESSMMLLNLFLCSYSLYDTGIV